MEVAMVVEQCWQRVPGGSGTYVARLSEQLSRAGVRVVGLRAAHPWGAQPERSSLPTVERTAVMPLPRRVLYDSWNTARGPRAELAVPSADVVHATTWAIPPTRRPLVVTVHDLAFLRAPEHFTPRGIRFFERSLERAKNEATLILVPSRATLDDCIEQGIEPERLALVPLGVEVTHPAPGAVSEFRARNGLSFPYVLWCGTVEPRKNVPALIEAFHAADLPQETQLVLVGPSGWGPAEASGGVTGSARVRHLGRLSYADLQCAYAGADAFCFPSLWEGFGLPVLEAMAHGVPVVTSRGTSMAEFTDGAGVLVDPHDTADIARGLERALGPSAAELRAAGRRIADGRTWHAVAEATARTYADAIERSA